MAAEFSFVAGDERIAVRIIAAENSSGQKQSSANRLDSTVTLSIGGFSGSFKAEFATKDLVALHEQLIRALATDSGRVSFKNTEDDLSLSIVFNGPGEAIISGTIQPHRMAQASLIFRLGIAQSSLARTANELENVLREFPQKS